MFEKILLSIAMLIFGLEASAAAVTIENITPDYEHQCINISGVLQYDGDAAVYSAFYNTDTEAYEPEGMYQFKTNDENRYSFSLPVKHTNRLIKIAVSGMDYREKNDTYEIFFTDKATIDKALEMLKSVTEIKKFFEDEEYKDYKYSLALKLDCFELVSDRENVYAGLAEKAQSFGDNLAEKFSEWNEYFDFLTAANAVSQAETAENALKIFTENTDKFDFSKSDYYQYVRSEYFTKAFLGGVVGGMRGYAYTNDAAFMDMLDKQIVLKSPAYVVYWTDTANVLKLFERDLNGINFAGYNTLGAKKTNVDRAVFGTAYQDYKALITAFNNAVAANKSVAGPTGGGSSSGGGGGGSSRSFHTETQLVSEKPEELFSDMNSGHWALDAVKELCAKGYISGYPDGTFRPSANIKKEEFVKIICSVFNLKYGGETDSLYSDVNKNDWFYEYVMAASENGVVNGTSEDIFGSGGDITREEMAVIAYRAMENGGYVFEDSGITFDDDKDISEWAKNQIGKMSGAGILNGYENKFNPKGNASRAEAAAMLRRVCNALKGGDE